MTNCLRRVRGYEFAAPAVVLGLGLWATMALYSLLRAHEFEHASLRFEQAALVRVDAIRKAINAGGIQNQSAMRTTGTGVSIDAIGAGAFAQRDAASAADPVSEIRLFAGGDANAADLVFQGFGLAMPYNRLPRNVPEWLMQEIPPLSRTFDAAGASWHVVARPSQALPDARYTGSMATLFAGGLLSIAIAAFMQLQVGRSRRIRRKFAERTTDLRAANTRLRHDLIVRRQTEQALRETQHVLTVAQKVAHLGSWELDPSTMALRCSDEMFRIFGMQPQDVSPSLDVMLGMVHADDRDATRAAILAVRDGVDEWRQELRIVRPDGAVRHAISVGEITRDDRQRVLQMTGSLLDVTEQKKTEMEQKMTEIALRQSREELRRLVAHQESMVEEERKRIAREVHDELGGLLIGIGAHLSVSMERAARSGAPTDDLLAEAFHMVDRASESMRKVITDLRPSVLDHLGVWAALKWYAEQTEARTGLVCECKISNSAAATLIDTERGTVLFRIVQEALTNVVRHAQASHVMIRVKRLNNAIRVEIEDDGRGFDCLATKDRAAWGIVGMQERARYFGGDFSITGVPGKGTAVHVWLPLDNSIHAYP